VKEQVEAALNDIRPQLQADGGDIELVEVTEDGVVKVRLVGACAGCPGAAMTLQLGVERVVKARVPDVKAVEAV
jgi:Fe-S cluster biogenesis protein NfuA